MKFSTIALAAVACLVSAAPAAPVGTGSHGPQSIPEEAIVGGLQGTENEIFVFFNDDESGKQGIAIIDAKKAQEAGFMDPQPDSEVAAGNAKREASPEAWRWFWLPGYGEPNWKRDAMPADMDKEKREANPEAWRWFWLPGYGEPNWKRDAMPADMDKEKREANPEAWRWFWLPGYGEPNWKRDAMPADMDKEKREANPKAWRWFWLPGYGEPNW
jgi:mating pheromone alpha-factor